MTALKQFLCRIPYWAYILVITGIAVNAVYLYYKGQVPVDGLTYDNKNGQWIVVDYHPRGAGYNAGIRPGDIILSINSRPLETWLDGYQGRKAGDSGIYKIIRNQKEIMIRVTLDSAYSQVIGFFWILFFVMLMLRSGC